MTKLTRTITALLTTLVPLTFTACEDDVVPSEESEVPTSYEFESRFEDGVSSVSYSGQAARHVLIAELTQYIGGFTDQIDSASFMPVEDGEVVETLEYYFAFDGDAYGESLLDINLPAQSLQDTHNSVSTNKDLVGKLAGNDTATDQVDWTTDFAGWSNADITEFGGSTTSPEGLVNAFFETIEQNALDHARGFARFESDGVTLLPVHVTESGLDLQQLTQKFLLGAIAFHQGTDDYLDDDVDGKGLLSPNTRDDDAPYTSLEHAWDEGFGYFGASRTYGLATDEEIAGSGGRDGWADGWYDADGDGLIDLTSEYIFGHAANAAKRDLGAVTPTNFTADAFDAFVAGRHLISNAGETLTEDELTSLRGYRDTIVLAWENAIASTVVHYINDVLVDMATMGTEEYSFLDHAKHWSELKGFALSFQFNPRSPLSDNDFVAFHELIGDAPVLETASSQVQADYVARLIDARDILANAYAFDAANLGDDNGENGW